MNCPPRIIRLFSIVFLAGLAACATPDPYDPVSRNSTYFCDNSYQMVLALGDRAQYASVSYEGRNLHLERIKTRADGEAFSNSIYTLYHRDEDDQKEAVLEREGIPVLTGCRPEQV